MYCDARCQDEHDCLHLSLRILSRYYFYGPGMISPTELCGRCTPVCGTGTNANGLSNSELVFLTTQEGGKEKDHPALSHIILATSKSAQLAPGQALTCDCGWLVFKNEGIYYKHSTYTWEELEFILSTPTPYGTQNPQSLNRLETDMEDEYSVIFDEKSFTSTTWSADSFASRSRPCYMAETHSYLYGKHQSMSQALYSWVQRQKMEKARHNLHLWVPIPFVPLGGGLWSALSASASHLYVKCKSIPRMAIGKKKLLDWRVSNWNDETDNQERFNLNTCTYLRSRT